MHGRLLFLLHARQLLELVQHRGSRLPDLRDAIVPDVLFHYRHNRWRDAFQSCNALLLLLLLLLCLLLVLAAICGRG